MKTTTRKLPPLAAITGIALTFATAQSHAASTILVDIGISSQQTSTTGWNNLTAASGIPASLTNLVTSTGTTTAISLTYTGTSSGGIAGTGANWGGPYPSALSAIPASALRDGLFLNSGSITLTLGGLDPLLTYNFTLYGARGNNGGDSIYTANGQNSATGSITSVFQNSTQVVNLTGIRPNASNAIDLVITGADISSTKGGALNFMQIDAVPEPSTALLGGLGLLALLRRRRN